MRCSVYNSLVRTVNICKSYNCTLLPVSFHSLPLLFAFLSIVLHKIRRLLWRITSLCPITPNTSLLPSHVIYVPFEIVSHILCTLSKIWHSYHQGTSRAGPAQTNFVDESDYNPLFLLYSWKNSNFDSLLCVFVPFMCIPSSDVVLKMCRFEKQV